MASKEMVTNQMAGHQALSSYSSEQMMIGQETSSSMSQAACQSMSQQSMSQQSMSHQSMSQQSISQSTRASEISGIRSGSMKGGFSALEGLVDEDGYSTISELSSIDP